jgi:hypothetical protein
LGIYLNEHVYQEAVMEAGLRQHSTNTAQPVAHKLIASDRVEGTAVCRPDTGKSIGTIQRLMIDKLSGKVAYAVMTFGGFLGFGERHFPIPWSALRYDQRWGAYVTDITPEQLKDVPSHAADEAFDWGDRTNEERLRQFQRQYPSYWA